jgi:hypothetical protein
MEGEVGPLELPSEDAFPTLPRVRLPTLAGSVLLPLAALLAMGARESEASAVAAARACTAAERTWAAWEQRSPAFGHCAPVRRWDARQLASAGVALAGGLGVLAFGLTRRDEASA